MAEIKLMVYPVSEIEQKGILKKFPAYASAKLSERAQKEGCWKNATYGTGWYFTRSALMDSSPRVLCGFDDGDLLYRHNYCDHGSVRIALQIIYNPESNVVKSCEMKTKTELIFNRDSAQMEKVTTTAPIVVFGKKEYVWLNKEECENGTAKTMELVSVKLLARSVPFDKDGKSTDFAKAVELQKQYFDVATENCTEEELEMLVPVVMNDKDNYNSATPILETEKKTNTTPSSNKVADKDKGGK